MLNYFAIYALIFCFLQKNLKLERKITFISEGIIAEEYKTIPRNIRKEFHVECNCSIMKCFDRRYFE